jgi:hypothetical protein
MGTDTGKQSFKADTHVYMQGRQGAFITHAHAAASIAQDSM